MSDKYLTRIAALLRKAEGTDNEHEADAYLQAAQRLATLASVDLAVARAHTAGKERRAVPVMREVVIGEPGKRGLRTFAALFIAIAAQNDLTCDITQNSTKVYAYGFESDLDTVQQLYGSLVVQMVRASDTYIKSGAYKADTVWREVRAPNPRRPGRSHYTYEERPVSPTSARIAFQLAFAARIGRRFAEIRATTRTEVITKDTTTGTALALRAKELELADHYREHSTARGAWRGGRYEGAADLAIRAGDRAGRTARLGPDGQLGGPGRQIGA